MRLVSFRRDGLRVGLLSCRGVHELDAPAGADTPVAAAAVAPELLELARLHAPGSVKLLPPVRPALVVSVDDNYRDQPGLRRGGLAAQRVAALEPFLAPGPADHAWVLLRDPRSVVAPPGPVVRPARCTRLDCGVSLAVVVGQPLHGVAPEDVPALVAGVTVALDVVRRDVPPGRAALARSYPTHSPLGPALVTVDEAPLDVDRPLMLQVNGRVWQESSTGQMVADAAHVVAAVARRIPLAPGDVVLTGTPGGTAEDHGGGWLEPGDEIVADIGDVGRLELRVAAEAG